jgi:hypothetical protein
LIGVNEKHFMALLRQGGGDISCHGGFSNPALLIQERQHGHK